MRLRHRAGSLALLALLAAAPWTGAHAGAMRFCDQPVALSAAQKDTLFRFGGVVKNTLDASGESVALIARSGLNLDRFGVRYSHAGVSLKASRNTPWSVRQLYYACDEQRPKVYDQGISGFLLGLDDPRSGYVSVVLLPAPQAAALERAALDDRRALQQLSQTYSANAYPFSLRYQNCNQWVAEMLAAAWGAPAAGPAAAPADQAPGTPAAADAPAAPDLRDARARAQRWLQDSGYQPSAIEVGPNPLLWLGAAFIPWLHNDDHPSSDIDQKLYRVSMPASIEDFVRRTVPGARRIEFCHDGQQVVVHRGWEPLADGCVPGEGDQVVMLD